MRGNSKRFPTRLSIYHFNLRLFEGQSKLYLHRAITCVYKIFDDVTMESFVSKLRMIFAHGFSYMRILTIKDVNQLIVVSVMRFSIVIPGKWTIQVDSVCYILNQKYFFTVDFLQLQMKFIGFISFLLSEASYCTYSYATSNWCYILSDLKQTNNWNHIICIQGC